MVIAFEVYLRLPQANIFCFFSYKFFNHSNKNHKSLNSIQFSNSLLCSFTCLFLECNKFQQLIKINKKSNAGMQNAKNQEIILTYQTTMRHQPHTLSIQHKQLKQEIRILRQENAKLKKRLEKMEDAMHQVYLSKKKYKTRFKEIKQKYDILEKVYSVTGKVKKIEDRDCMHGEYGLDVGYKEMTSERRNLIHHGKRHDLTSNTHQLKQDLTSNTLQTMPSSRKSETKDFLRRPNQSRNLKESNSSKSQVKDVGKIFNFKSQQKERLRYHSSGSEGEVNKRHTGYGWWGQSILRQQRQRSPVSGSNYETVSQYGGNQGQLKQLIEHLISQLQSFSTLQNEQQALQKQVQLITTQNLLSKKLQQMSNKLNKIQTNQQALIMRISQREYHQMGNEAKESPEGTKMNKKVTQLMTSSRERMSASFLRTIEDIGKDLSEWKIDYVKGRGR